MTVMLILYQLITTYRRCLLPVYLRQIFKIHTKIEFWKETNVGMYFLGT